MRAMLAAVALGAAVLLVGSLGGARADDVLQNGGFEQWSGSTPTGWIVIGPATAAPVTSPAVAGQALALTGPASGAIRQTVPAVPGTYTVGAMVAGGLGAARAL